MLPQVRAAEWRDRADAALADVDEIDLRDLRSVVGADDAARDEESRAIASQLREALTTRVEKEHSAWLDEIGTALDEARIVRRAPAEHTPAQGRRSLPGPAREPAHGGCGRGLARDRDDRSLGRSARGDRVLARAELSGRGERPGPDSRRSEGGSRPVSGCAPPDRSPVRHRAARGHGSPEAAPADAPAPSGEAGRDRERALPLLHPLRRQLAEPQMRRGRARTGGRGRARAEVEAAPEPAAEAAPVEAPDAPVEAPEPAAVEPPAPEAPAVDEAPRQHRPKHRARLRFPPISLASLRRHGHGRVRDARTHRDLHPQPS